MARKDKQEFFTYPIDVLFLVLTSGLFVISTQVMTPSIATANPSPSPPCTQCPRHAGVKQCVNETIAVATAKWGIELYDRAMEKDELNMAFDLASKQKAIDALAIINPSITANIINRNQVVNNPGRSWMIPAETDHDFDHFQEGGSTDPQRRWDSEVNNELYVPLFKKENLNSTATSHGQHNSCKSYEKVAVANNHTDNPAYYYNYRLLLVNPSYGTVARNAPVQPVTDTGPNVNHEWDELNQAVINHMNTLISSLNSYKSEEEVARDWWDEKYLEDSFSWATNAGLFNTYTTNLQIAQLALTGCEITAWPTVTYSCGCGS